MGEFPGFDGSSEDQGQIEIPSIPEIAPDGVGGDFLYAQPPEGGHEGIFLEVPQLPGDGGIFQELPELPGDDRIFQEPPDLPRDDGIFLEAPELPGDDRIFQEPPDLPRDDGIFLEAPELPGDDRIFLEVLDTAGYESDRPAEDRGDEGERKQRAEGREREYSEAPEQPLMSYDFNDQELVVIHDLADLAEADLKKGADLNVLIAIWITAERLGPGGFSVLADLLHDRWQQDDEGKFTTSLDVFLAVLRDKGGHAVAETVKGFIADELWQQWSEVDALRASIGPFGDRAVPADERVWVEHLSGDSKEQSDPDPMVHARVGSFILDCLPVVGDIKGVMEAIAGEDILGNKLETWERILGVLPLLPPIGKLFRMADKVDDVGDIAKQVDDAGDIAKPADRSLDAHRRAQESGGPAASNVSPDDVGPHPAIVDDFWLKGERERGRQIQDHLARAEYQEYLETDSLPGYEKARNFPLVDFVSADHTHSVSIKTHNPFAKTFASGDTIYDLVNHADELAYHAPGSRVTLDIRVPPGTPDHVTEELRETILEIVDSERLEVIVRTFP